VEAFVPVMKRCARAADGGVLGRAGCASISLLLLMSAGGVGGGCCAETSRRYEIDGPDDALAAMVQACQAEIASTCASKTAAVCAPQACVDVCKRVMTIAGDDPHGLKLCIVNPATPSGAALEVIVTSCG
jgi:hypothetical protein